MGGDAAGLTPQAPLLELNIIDSAAIFDFVYYLQAEFGVVVPLSDVTPHNFASIEAIAAMVDRLRSERVG
ncbi:MAG: acyl carrier protein [Jatrophihabitantaceae bacterium]